MADPKRVLALVLVGLVATAGSRLAAQSPEDAGQAAAESWLALVDSGNYAGAWDQAAKVLKAGARQPEWTQATAGMRSPLGRLASRKLKSREYTEKAPTTRVVGGKAYTWGSGRYVVLEYDTAFGSRPSAAETVVATAEADGAWRVASYSVR